MPWYPEKLEKLHVSDVSNWKINFFNDFRFWSDCKDRATRSEDGQNCKPKCQGRSRWAQQTSAGTSWSPAVDCCLVTVRGAFAVTHCAFICTKSWPDAWHHAGRLVLFRFVDRSLLYPIPWLTYIDFSCFCSVKRVLLAAAWEVLSLGGVTELHLKL